MLVVSRGGIVSDDLADLLLVCGTIFLEQVVGVGLSR